MTAANIHLYAVRRHVYFILPGALHAALEEGTTIKWTVRVWCLLLTVSLLIKCRLAHADVGFKDPSFALAAARTSANDTGKTETTDTEAMRAINHRQPGSISLTLATIQCKMALVSILLYETEVLFRTQYHSFDQLKLNRFLHASIVKTKSSPPASRA